MSGRLITSKRAHRKRQPIIEQPPLIIPPTFVKWARLIASTNYILQKIAIDKDDKTQYHVEVIVPKGLDLVKPDFAAGWGGHKIVAWSTQPARDKGIFIFATLGV